MGSIQYIYNPKKWEIILEGKSKLLPDDYIYQMSIGWCDDELSSGEICIFISKENYDNLLKGQYWFQSFPYNTQKIIIFNKNNEIIPLVKGQNDSEYGLNQQKFIKQLKK